MQMDPASITLLGISATLLVGLAGVIVSIFATSNATHRRLDDFRADTDRRFEESERQIAELRIDFRSMRADFRDLRGRVDHVADSLNLGRSRTRKRA